MPREEWENREEGPGSVAGVARGWAKALLPAALFSGPDSGPRGLVSCRSEGVTVSRHSSAWATHTHLSMQSYVLAFQTNSITTLCTSARVCRSGSAVVRDKRLAA